MNFNPNLPYKVPPISVEQLKKAQLSLTRELTEANIALAQVKGFLRGLPHSGTALMIKRLLKALKLRTSIRRFLR